MVGQVTEAGAESGSGESSEEIIFEVNNLWSVGINWAKRKTKVADRARNFETSGKKFNQLGKGVCKNLIGFVPGMKKKPLNVFYVCLHIWIHINENDSSDTPLSLGGKGMGLGEGWEMYTNSYHSMGDDRIFCLRLEESPKLFPDSQILDHTFQFGIWLYIISLGRFFIWI